MKTRFEPLSLRRFGGVLCFELGSAAEVARFVGRGYAAYLAERGIGGPVAVGRDNRPSGDMLRDALVGGLTECGVDVVRAQNAAALSRGSAVAT